MKKVEDYYPITTRVDKTGAETLTQKFITVEDLKNYTKPAEYASLVDYLVGSTRYLEGVYIHDVERWLNNMPNLD